MSRLLFLILTLSLLVTACAVEDDDSYSALSTIKQDSAGPGRYRVPPEVETIGDSQDAEYTGAGRWNGQSSCQGGMTDGAEALRDFLNDKFSQIDVISGYSCRHIVGNSSQTSVHATGRALDIMIPLGYRSQANNIEGDPVANFLIANAEDIGIQFIIWDRTTWGAHRDPGKKERYYGGHHPHNDHLHIEITEEAGRGETPWLRSGWTPVEDYANPEPRPEPEEPEAPEPQPEEPNEDPPEDPAPTEPDTDLPPEDDKPDAQCNALPAAGGVIDNNCLWLRGPTDFWNRESLGNDDDLAWTYAFQSGSHLNSAEWEISLKEAGNFDVEIFGVEEFATYSGVRYVVHHDGTATEVIVDQSKASGWYSIGSFSFAAGKNQKLTLFDNTDDAVTGAGKRIMVDAIRLSPKAGPANEEPNDGKGTDDDSDNGQVDPADDKEAPGALEGGCQQAPGDQPLQTGLLGLLVLGLLRRRRHQEVR